MLHNKLKILAVSVAVSLFINITVAFGHHTNLHHNSIVEPPAISQEDKAHSFITSLNAGKGAAYYEMQAGVRNGSELYLIFDKRCFRIKCKDCDKVLRNHLRPMLVMVLSEWTKITGSEEVNIIGKGGLHRWTFNSNGLFKYHNPFLRKNTT